MGKHLNAKQRELEKKLKNQQKGMMYTKSTEAVSVPTLQAAPTKAEVSQNTAEISALETPRTLKTKAKAMGLKSTLVFDDKIVVTSFLNSKTEGDEKCAHIEKIADCKGQTIVERPRMFNTSINTKKIDLSKDNDETNYPNPAFEDCGRDYINIKSALERRVFGKTYDKDNLHVQIAYNIFDIKKIIGTYINNIIYIFYNLGREEYNPDSDIIGAVKTNAEHTKKILENTSAYFTYFDGVFERVGTKDDDEVKEKKRKHNETVIETLSYLRQFCMHGKVGKEGEGLLADTVLYNARSFFAKTAPQINTLIDDIYTKAVETINSDFIKQAKNNIYVINKVYRKESQDTLLKEYYDFVVRKEGNNLGVDTRQIREILIDEYFKNLRDKKYDTCRNKLYTILGFILARELKRNVGIRDNIIWKLRANKNGEKGKSSIYVEYASTILHLISEKFEKATEIFDEQIKSKFEGGKNVNINTGIVNSYGITSNNTDEFSKIIYFLCKFLDGKEINELCCAIINKLENINDLIQTARQCKTRIEFTPEYSFFTNSKGISEQIRIVKSISKMKLEVQNVSESLLLDAMAMLGEQIDKYKRDANGACILDSNKHPIYSEEYKVFKKRFFETFEFDKNGKQVENHRQRNFIINNVLSSKWFFYIAKYSRPTECRIFMQNKTLIAFALKDIPETQIARYYRSVTGEKEPVSFDKMRATIVNMLHDFSIKAIISEVGEMSKWENMQQEEDCRKEQMKAIVKLYLTVAYLITKSLIKINTRFSIAFSAYERDVSLLYEEDAAMQVGLKDGWKKSGYGFALTKKFLDNDTPYFNKFLSESENIKNITDSYQRAVARRVNDKILKKMHFSSHSYKYVKNNYDEICNNGKIITLFRNYVQHLTVVNKITKYLGQVKSISSYYAFYCYTLQMLLLENNENYKFAKIKESLLEFGTYNKNFMWVLNVVFAYNLPRYKNLSNETIFYDESQG